MDEFLFPRTVTITRPAAQTGEGAVPYGGKVQSAETQVAAGVPASIQAKREGQRNPVGLPADGTKAIWLVMLPDGLIADGVIVDGDIATDDLGRRFQVTSDYTHPMGATFSCERLEP